MLSGALRLARPFPKLREPRPPPSDCLAGASGAIPSLRRSPSRRTRDAEAARETRSVLCASLVHEDPKTNNASSPHSESMELASTLLTLPAELQPPGRGRTELFTRHFVLLSRTDGFGRTSDGDFVPVGETVTLSKSEMELAQAFKYTGLYQILLRGCSSAVWKSKFWREAVILPARIRPDRSWEIAWEVVHALTDAQSLEDCQSFIPLLLHDMDRGTEPSPELLQIMERMQIWMRDAGPELSSGRDWESVAGFLEKCVLLGGQGMPVVSLTLKLPAAKATITGNFLNPDGDLEKLLSHPPEVPSTLNLRPELYSLFPVTEDWLLAFLLASHHLPEAAQQIDCLRLRKAFSMGVELPLGSFLDNLTAHAVDNKKAATQGDALLRLVTLMDLWQNSANSTVATSKVESAKSSESIRAVRIGEKIAELPPIMDVFLSWADVQRDALPHNLNWESLIPGTEPSLHDVTEGAEYLTPTTAVGRNFKAFVASCYDVFGMGVVWKLAKAIGLVQLQSWSFIGKYVEGWSGQGLQAGKLESWEKLHSVKRNSIPGEAYQRFCRTFGYTFKQKLRFDCAMHHSSVVGVGALYGWMAVLGKAILDLFFQHYVTKTRPEMPQKTVNAFYNDSTKMDMCIDVAVDLGIHLISQLTTRTITVYMARNGNDRKALREDNATRAYLATVMFVFVGCLAWDLGFNLEQTFAVMEPHFGKVIENWSEQVAPAYYRAELYVPKRLETRHFSQPTAGKTEFCLTLVQLVHRDTEAPFFSFYVLSKLPLPQVPEFELFHHIKDVALIGRVTAFENLVQIPAERYEMLLPLQSAWFEPILPPATKPVPAGPQNKKYFVAPALDENGTADSIDWDFVQYIVKKTVPPEISHFLQYFVDGHSTSDRELLHQTAERVRGLDRAICLSDDAELSDPLEDALHRLVFLAEERQVVTVKSREGAVFCGDVLNGQCMLDLADLHIRGRNSVKSLEFSPSTAQCLPYTAGYFMCLACVPYVLDALESRLLADDYREEYALPPSIPKDSVLLALSVTSELNVVPFERLEALGRAVAHYLNTIELIFKNPNRRVGQLSVERTVVQNSAKMARSEDECFLLGHINLSHFPAYTGWCPPGDGRVTYQSIQAEEAEETSEEEPLSRAALVFPVRGRVTNGNEFNLSAGVPQKHYKAMAGLCFLHEGIEAALHYLRKIGHLALDRYPSRTSAPKTFSPLKKYNQVQETLGYRFRDPSMLAMAFMHSSAFPNPKENNEILEFLGDAVLDLCMWRHIYRTYPTLSVAKSTLLKMHLTSNHLFAWFAESPPLQLQRFLMHNVAEYKAVRVPPENARKEDWEDAPAMKMSSDVFEALMGAVLIDSGYSIETVSAVVSRVMKEVFDDLGRFGIDDPVE